MVFGAFGLIRRKPLHHPASSWFEGDECHAPVGWRCAFASSAARLFVPERTAGFASRQAWSAVACGSIVNRVELAVQIGLDASAISDGALLAEAYQRWGRDCCSRIYGNWCLAAWDEDRQELFLARDHHGNSALYYHVSDEAIAFSTSLSQLLALKLAPITLERLYLAQVLVAWPAYHSERTALEPIKRVPPAHTVVITPDGICSRRYWRLEDVEPLDLTKREDYAAGFREVFDKVVRESLPSTGTPALALSSGLDSGSIAVTAAAALAEQRRRISAYISVPVGDYQQYIGQSRIGDERPLAQVTAGAMENIDLHPIEGHLSPIAGIRRMLDLVPSPQHGASNCFWLIELYTTAAAQGCPVLLTGQFGNGGISWEGDVFSQPLLFQFRQLGPWRWIKRRAKQVLPPAIFNRIRRSRQRASWELSAIRPEFADDLHLLELWLDDPLEAPYLPPFLSRCDALKPGRSRTGELHAAYADAAGISVIDPSADPRVLEFCFSVPDHIFIDPETGMDRWLIRAAMKGRLPDAVRLNRKRGIQAADLVPRLRACRDEVEEALDECANGTAADYVDAPHMRRVWQRILTEDNGDVFRLAINVLTRGIMTGLFVNGIAKR